MLRALYKILVPYRIRNKARARLQAHFNAQSARERERVEQALPKHPLADKHVRNCRLLSDRKALLSCLPRGGTVAELGVAKGDFSEVILQTNAPRQLHLVDTWDSVEFPLWFKAAVRDRFLPLVHEGRVHIHQSSSVGAAESFENGYFDWVYIDTDHSYASTLNELIAYAPKVKPDGFLAGHDYCMGNWVTSYRYGVIEAVHQFCVEHDWELAYLTAQPAERQSFAIRRIR